MRLCTALAISQSLLSSVFEDISDTFQSVYVNRLSICREFNEIRPQHFEEFASGLLVHQLWFTRANYTSIRNGTKFSVFVATSISCRTVPDI